MVEEIEKNKLLLIGGHQGPKGTVLKKKAWDRVSDILNDMRAPGSNPRTAQQWNRVWRDLVINAKKRNTAKKRDFSQTGGGPPKVPPLPSMIKRILNLVSEQADGVAKSPKGTVTRSRNKPANIRSEIERSLCKVAVPGPSKPRTSSTTSSTSSTSSDSQANDLKSHDELNRESNGRQELKSTLSQDVQFPSESQPSQPIKNPHFSPIQQHPISQDLPPRPVPLPPSGSTSRSSNIPAPQPQVTSEAQVSSWEVERGGLLEKLATRDKILQMKDLEINRLREDNNFLKNEFIAMRTMAHELINKIK